MYCRVFCPATCHGVPPAKPGHSASRLCSGLWSRGTPTYRPRADHATSWNRFCATCWCMLGIPCPAATSSLRPLSARGRRRSWAPFHSGRGRGEGVFELIHPANFSHPLPEGQRMKTYPREPSRRRRTMRGLSQPHTYPRVLARRETRNGDIWPHRAKHYTISTCA